MKRIATLAFVLAACGDTYVVVTVDAQPGVIGTSTLKVVATNDGATSTSTLDLGAHQFPATFSVTTSGRNGAIDLALSALGSDGTLLAVGSGSADAGDVTITLDPADFIVNTDTTSDNFLSSDYEAKGFQVAATDGGPWTVSFRNDCTNDCQIFARMFDQTGQPLKTEVASSTNEFTLSTTATDDETFPAVGAANASTLVAWDFTDGSGAEGIGCRGVDASGALANATQGTLSNDAADVAMVAPLSSGDFAISWQVITPTVEIRTVVAQPDCTPVGAVQTASTIVGASEGPHRAAIADNGSSVLYTWITDGAVHARSATSTGAFNGPEATLFPAQAGYTIEQARIAPLGAGFGVAVRMITTDGTTGGQLVLLTTNAAGQLLTPTPTTISTQTGADFSVGAQGFGIATRSDGATLIAWQQCDDGSAGPCAGRMDVYGAVVDSTGAIVDPPFEIPTTTDGDQDSPAVAALGSAFAVAWNDASSATPHAAVRARVIYPP